MTNSCKHKIQRQLHMQPGDDFTELAWPRVNRQIISRCLCKLWAPLDYDLDFVLQHLTRTMRRTSSPTLE